MDPSTVSGSIGIGVVTGVLSAALIWLVSHTWLTAVSPWFENLSYRGVLIDGKWRSEQLSFDIDHGNRLEILLELTQSGYKVSGIFRARTVHPGDVPDYENLYQLSGEIRDNNVVLNYCASSRRRVGLGALVLQVKDGGKGLRGSISFVEESDLGVESVSEVHLRRVVD